MIQEDRSSGGAAVPARSPPEETCCGWQGDEVAVADALGYQQALDDGLVYLATLH